MSQSAAVAIAANSVRKMEWPTSVLSQSPSNSSDFIFLVQKKMEEAAVTSSHDPQGAAPKIRWFS
jgi:hypothetical protein